MTLPHFTKYYDKTRKTHVLVQDLKRDRELREAFEQDESAALDRYALTPDERLAIEQRDFKTLYELGVHPYLLGQLSRLIHGTVEGAGSSEAAVALVRSLKGEAGPSTPTAPGA